MKSKWISVKDALPECSKKPDSFGVCVLVWPPIKEHGSSDLPIAFYGCRVTDEPSFYIYGKIVDVTHWMPLPEGPKK